MRPVIIRSKKGWVTVRTVVVWVTLLALLASLGGVLATFRPAEAADFSAASEFKLTASDGAASDYFGWSVAISGDTAVVGVSYDNVGDNAYQGSAYIFVRSGSSWSQQAKLTASDGAASDYFGWSVAISGDTVVVGAHLDDVEDNVDQGSAYVFTRNGTSWSEQQKLTASDGAAYDDFGCSVAIDGDTAVVGAYYHDVGDNANQGSAYVFTRSGTSWSEQAQLTASDGDVHDWFGYSVDISGDTAVAGAYHDDVGSNYAQGSAYVFIRSGTSWSEQGQLTASDGNPDDNFGCSVGIDADTVVVGAHFDDVGANAAQGSAYVFIRSGTTWSEQKQLTASDGAAYDYFGCSVAIAGDTALVGARGGDVGANAGQGSAYVFTRTGTAWAEQTKLTASDGAANDNFGCSVAMDADTVAVGACEDDVEVNADQGSAYVYEGAAVAQVAATFTLQSISITVAIPEGYPTAVDYGLVEPNAWAVPVSYTPGTYQYLRVQNNGNVAEDFFIKGADATCGVATLTLAATPGADQYSHLYGIGETPTDYSLMSILGESLGANVPMNGTVDFNLKLRSPTSFTVNGQYSTTVTILAVAYEE